MGVKLHEFGDAHGILFFRCPGCGNAHPFHVAGNAAGRQDVWTWNGSMEAPTFRPSLLCNRDYPESRCHSYVTDGQIQFLDDCWHGLRGRTVPLPDWDDDPASV